jgi:hypothetical protein
MNKIAKGIWKLVNVNADGSCVFQELHSGFASDEPKVVSAMSKLTPDFLQEKYQ